MSVQEKIKLFEGESNKENKEPIEVKEEKPKRQKYPLKSDKTKFIFKYLNEDGTIKEEKEFRTLIDVATYLNLEIHIVRKIHKLTENDIQQKFNHKRFDDIYKYYKIYGKKYELK